MVFEKTFFEAIEMFMDHLDFGLYPWDTNIVETGEKGEIYVQDMNMLRKMYKLKNIYEKQKQPQQPNSNNWNFGSVPAHLLKKKG